MPERPTQRPGRPGAGEQPETRPGGGVAERPEGRPAQLPAKPGAGLAERPGGKPSQRPSAGEVGNFLGIAGGAAAGGAIGGALANRPAQLPAERPGVGERPVRPEERPNWGEWSQNRGGQWQQRVDNRNDAWNQRAENRQQAHNNFQQTRDERWNNLESAREDRQAWRDQNREDWQQHRQDLWNYRGERAEEVWDNARDFYDDVFDDRWWGACGWGGAWIGNYPINPWWWWAPAAFGTVAAFIDVVTPDPIYVDYGMNVIYEGDTVYVNDQPVPTDQYVEPAIDLATNVDQPPPPLPVAGPAPAAQPTATPTTQPAAAPTQEWMPLGVFALVQEEKGDPTMFFQISVNRAGVISGAYTSVITGDERPIAGQVDKTTQRAAWRIGDNMETIFETSLANLTQDVSPVAIHFGKGQTQVWLLVRMPEPAPGDQSQQLPEAPKTPPPLANPKT